MAAALNVIIRNMLVDALKKSAPGISEIMREAIANGLTMKLAAKVVLKDRPFYGAECPDYPDCKGGCGLGCTHEMESGAAAPKTPDTPTREQIQAAIEVFNDNGIDFRAPWECTLDDCERGRFEALQCAIQAALDARPSPSVSRPHREGRP